MAFENWAEVFTAIEPICTRYGFSIHKGWKHLINKEVGLTLKITVSKNTIRSQDVVWIEPTNGTRSKAKSWRSPLDVFLQISSQFEDWIRESIGLPSLAERDRQLSEIAAEIERCDHALVLSELNPIADPSETQKAKEYKERLYDEIKRIDPIAPSDQSDEDLLIELGVLPSRMEAPQEINQDVLIGCLSALDTPTLEAMSSLDWSTFDHDPSVIEITRDAIAAELGKRKATSSDDLNAEAEISHSDPIAASLECFEEYKEVLAILGIGSEDSLTDVALILHEAIRDPAYDKHGLHVPLFEAEEKLDTEYPEIPLIPPSGSRSVYHPQIPQIEPEAINVDAVEVKQQWVGPRQAVYRNLLGEITSIEMIDKPKKPKNTNPNQLGLF